MRSYLIHHRHDPHHCGVVFASFRGHASALRHRVAFASCAFGGHAIWWIVHASSEEDALGHLPFFVAQRSFATEVRETEIP
jgi:hypothetical protein